MGHEKDDLQGIKCEQSVSYGLYCLIQKDYKALGARHKHEVLGALLLTLYIQSYSISGRTVEYGLLCMY